MGKVNVVQLKGACRYYSDEVHALDQVDLDVKEGEWISIMGPSGSGKTTLLNLIDGLDRPTSGKVEVLGKEITGLSSGEIAKFRRENLGLVFQQFHLIGYLTALENVMLAQYYHSMVDKKQAMAALEHVGLTHRTRHLPDQLSIGEQQRVCLARALINDPKIILADEPTGNLDEANAEKVLELFQDLHHEGSTLIVVTHDREVGEKAQRIINIKHGKIIHEERVI